MNYDDDSDDDSINTVIDKNYVIGIVNHVVENDDDEFEYSANETMSVEHILEACRDFNRNRHDTDMENINLNISMHINFHANNDSNNDANGSILNATYSSDGRDASGMMISSLDQCSTYRGSWSNDLPHGFGIIELRNGQIFMADFYRGVKRS